MTPSTTVLMGVAGSGKSTLAREIAALLEAHYLEADDYHPAANVAKMAAGTPLTDEDRWPWLTALAQAAISQHQQGNSVVMTCSALKRRYRDHLRDTDPTIFLVHLDGPAEVIASRMQQRTHFMPPALLASQLADLEPLGPDEPGVRIDLDQPLADLITQVAAAVRTNKRL